MPLRLPHAEKALRQRAKALADDLKLEARHVGLAAETAPTARGQAVLSVMAKCLGHASRNVAYAADFDPGYNEPFRQDAMALHEGVGCIVREALYADVDTLRDLVDQLDRLSEDWPDSE